jgi:hypothetical protein
VLLFILFASGFLGGLVVASMLRRTGHRLALAVVGIALWTFYAIYIEGLASCPAQGECDKGIGVIFLGVVLVSWLVGVAASWIVRRPRRRDEA